jgi:hypothetical protein
MKLLISLLACSIQVFAGMTLKPSYIDLTLKGNTQLSSEYFVELESENGFAAKYSSGAFSTIEQSAVLSIPEGNWEIKNTFLVLSDADERHQYEITPFSFQAVKGLKEPVFLGADRSVELNFSIDLSICSKTKQRVFLTNEIHYSNIDGKNSRIKSKSMFDIPSVNTLKNFTLSVSGIPRYIINDGGFNINNIWLECGDNATFTQISNTNEKKYWVQNDQISLGEVLLEESQIRNVSKRNVSGVTDFFSGPELNGSQIFTPVYGINSQVGFYNSHGEFRALLSPNSFQTSLNVDEDFNIFVSDEWSSMNANSGVLVHYLDPIIDQGILSDNVDIGNLQINRIYADNSAAYVSNRISFVNIQDFSVRNLKQKFSSNRNNKVIVKGSVEALGTDHFDYKIPLITNGEYSFGISNGVEAEILVSEINGNSSQGWISFEKIMSPNAQSFLRVDDLLNVQSSPSKPYQINDYKIPTGQISFKFSSEGPESIRKPTLYSSRIGDRIKVDDGQIFNGKYQQDYTGKSTWLTAVVTPGYYEFKGEAEVLENTLGIRNITLFDKEEFFVGQGDKIIAVDGAPSISMQSPLAKSCYTSADNITLSGSLKGETDIPLQSFYRLNNGLENLLNTVGNSTGNFLVNNLNAIPGRNEIFIKTSQNDLDYTEIFRYFYLDDTAPLLSISNNNHHITGYHNNTYTLNGNVLESESELVSLKVDGRDVPVSTQGDFSTILDLVYPTNLIEIEAVNSCGQINRISLQIDIVNNKPTANTNCSELQENLFTGKQILLDGSKSTDADQDMLSFSWKKSGLEFSSQSSVNYSVLEKDDFSIKLCVNDLFEEDCVNCSFQLTENLIQEGCSKNPNGEIDPNSCQRGTTPPAGIEIIKGPELSNVFIKNSDLELFFLIQTCQAIDFETPQFIYLDTDEDINNGYHGFDVRYRIRFLRKDNDPSNRMKVSKEVWSSGKWRLESESTAKYGNNNTNNLPEFSLNYSSQSIPVVGVNASKNEIIEIAIPVDEHLPSKVRWYIDGSLFDVGSVSNPFEYKLINQSNISVDGNTCDWSDAGCIN